MTFGIEKIKKPKNFLKKFKGKKPDEPVSVVELMQGKKFEEALKLHESDPNEESVDYWYTKGYLQGNLNKIEAPIECYDKAISLEPNLSKVWYRKGQCLLKIKKSFEASVCFEKVLNIEKEFLSKKRQDLWSGPAVFSLMIAYISEYNKLNSENKETKKVKESTDEWTEKCFIFFKENSLIPEDTPESEFVGNSIKNFDEILDYLEPSLAKEYKIKVSRKLNLTKRSKIVIGVAVAITAIILILRLIVIQQPLFSG